MTMFLGYGHTADFFTGFEWRKTNPHDELANNGNLSQVTSLNQNAR
jgi:hypothetical protein